MKILTIGSDRNLFREGSSARERIARYGSIADEYHIVVFSLASQKLTQTKIAENVWAYPTNSSSKFWYVYDAWRLARTLGNFDLVSAQDPFESGLAAFLVVREKKARLQLQLHTDPFTESFSKESKLNRLRMVIARHIIPRADCIRVVSERIKEGLKNSGIGTKVLPDVLPISVDVADIVQAKPVFSLRQKYPQFNFTILMVSRLSKEKRIDLALSAVAGLVVKYPMLGLIIVGEGPERGALETQAEKLGIRDHVVFEGWQEDLISYYKGAGVYLLTSDYEGYGRTLIEAAAAGIPIVTTDVGTAKELFVHKDSVLICEVNTSESIAKYILSVIEDNTLRIRLTINARQKVTEQALGFDEYLQKMKELFANCCRAA